MASKTWAPGVVIDSHWLQFVDDKLAERVSVLDFGADPTGTADSTAAFNEALLASMRVHIPAGSYRIDGTIRINRTGVTLSGDGMGNTYLFGKSGSTSPVLDIESDGWAANVSYPGPRISDIVLRDFSISGVYATVRSDRDLLRVAGVGFDFHAERVYFYGSGRRAIYGEDLWDAVFSGCRVLNCAYSNTYHHAVVLAGKTINSNAIRFIGTHFEGNPTGDVWLKDSANQIFFIGNKFEGSNIDAAYDDFNCMLLDSGVAHVMFASNTITLFQKNKAVHWFKSSGRSVQINGNTFEHANDMAGACALQLTQPADVIGHSVVGNTFYVDGSTASYPLDLGGYMSFADNVINARNPRKLVRVGDGAKVHDNTFVGKGTVNQTGDIFVHFDGANNVVKDNTLYNVLAAVENNLESNIHEPITLGLQPVGNGFSPSNYRNGTVFSATQDINSISASYSGKIIVVKAGAGTDVIHNPAGGVILAGSANFAPANFGLITLAYYVGVGWVETSRMTYY